MGMTRVVTLAMVVFGFGFAIACGARSTLDANDTQTTSTCERTESECITGFAGNDFTGCIACAGLGPCKALIARCRAEPECVALQSCMMACETPGATHCGNHCFPSCETTCYAAHPTAIDIWRQDVSCVYCDECPNACGLTGFAAALGVECYAH